MSKIPWRGMIGPVLVVLEGYGLMALGIVADVTWLAALGGVLGTLGILMGVATWMLTIMISDLRKHMADMDQHNKLLRELLP